MAELIANCPRCGAKSITHDLTALHLVRKEHGWAKSYEAFAICRHCRRSTTFVINERANTHDADMFEQMSPIDLTTAINRYFIVNGFVALKDQATVAPPEHVPPDIANVFREGATCLAVECWNAAGTMFRLCVDLATRSMLPPEDNNVPGLNSKIRRDLGLRLPWLFDNGKLPTELRELSIAVREDGNDGAHRGTLTRRMLKTC